MSTVVVSRLGWCVRRAPRLSPVEMGWRLRYQVVRGLVTTAEDRPSAGLGRGGGADSRAGVHRGAAARHRRADASRGQEAGAGGRGPAAAGEWETLGVLHRRSVLSDRASRSIDITDQIDEGGQDILLAFHLGPDVYAELGESRAVLNWPTASTPGAAQLKLPPELRWSLHRGETDPILGWYSPGLGRRVPAVTLRGYGRCVPGIPLITRLEFLGIGKPGKSAVSRQAISSTTSAASSTTSVALSVEAPEIHEEAR